MSEPTPPFPPALESERPQQVWIITPPRQRWWLYVLFFVLTMFSTLVVGARMQYNFMQHQPVFSLNDDSVSLFPLGWVLQEPSHLLLGLPFSLTLMFILFAHEMGHYLYARHYRVYATPPFFVPFPSLIGTLGAFIRIKSPIPSRAALFDIGIAGPIAGFIPACIALFVGLTLSRPIPAPDAPYIELGFPLAFHFAAGLLHLATPLSALALHPIAVAAWVGMFATSLNLLPGGQLDGGHIIFSISPRLHRWVSVLAVLALVPLGRYFWSGWLLWAAMLVITRRHPDVPHRPSVSGVRRWICVLGILMLTLTFTSVPLTPHPDQKIWPELRDDARDAIHWLRDNSRRLMHRN
jgi:Zn-dependent protease